MMGISEKQKQANEALKEIKSKWDAMVEESGMNEEMFITASTGAVNFLANFKLVQDAMINEGLECPDLVDGLEIEIKA